MIRASQPSTVWVIAGPPGAGKTSVADELLRQLVPAPARLDKDTLFAPFVQALLAAHGRDFGEREGPWYDEHVKVHEYAAMTAAARQIRQACPVLLEAPFTGQIRDVAAWERWVADLGGEPVRLLWLCTDAATLRNRITARANPRDAGKLADFDAFIERMQPGHPPPVPHLVVDNRLGAPSLAHQLRSLL